MKSRSLLLVPAVLAALSSPSAAALLTLPASGWQHDVVINNNGGAYNTTVTGTMDNGPGNIENWTLVEAGTYPVAVGAVVSPTEVTGLSSGILTSVSGSGASFQFQPFDGPNALLLTAASSGTLTLATASRLSSFALFGLTSGGETSATVRVTFADDSFTDLQVEQNTGIGRDWFSPNEASLALTIGGRAANRSEDGYSTIFYQANGAISLYESLFTFSAEDQLKDVLSITVTNDGGGRLAVLALSGEVIPEPGTAMLAGLAGLLGLMSRRRA